MSFRPLDKTSDLYFAIADAIRAEELGVEVANYDDFDFEGTVGDATVLIEIEGTGPRCRSNDGRYVRVATVTLHAVVARTRGHSALEATNLAGLLEQMVDMNRWGFHGRQCEYPEDIHCGPSIYQKGRDGYDAWGCTFRQAIAPGSSKVADDPVLGMPLVAFKWEVPSVDDPEAYKPLEALG